jgi:MFS transporter, DHA1 family, multidrug resistance protein
MYMLYVIVFTVELGLGIVSPLLPEIMREFSLAAWQTGLMITVYGLARLATDLPLGLLLDRVDRALVLGAGALLIVLGAMGCALAQSFELLLAARLLMGVGTALCLVTALFSVSRAAHSRSRGRSIGIYQATMLAGFTISPAIGGLAASFAGWRAAFLFAAFAGTIALLMVIVASRRGLIRATAPPDGAASAMAKPLPVEPAGRVPWNLVAINFTTFIFFLSTAGFRNSMVPVYGGTSLGISAGTLGLLLGGSGVIRFIVTLGSGFASDRWGRKIILIPGILLLATGTLGFALATDTVSFTVCLLVLSLGGFGNSIPTTMLVDAVSGKRVGLAISANRAVGDLGMLLGPVGLGLVLDLAGFSTVAAVTAVLLLSALPGIAFGVKEQRWSARQSGE